MRDFVLIYINGRRHEIRGKDAFQPLSNFLRQNLELTGTKVVCSEGDCGACAVMVGCPEAGKDQLQWKAKTSCISFVHQLDGSHVLTVEGLTPAGPAASHQQRTPDETFLPHEPGEKPNPTKNANPLNPVQQAMVQCHGTQCGYCTPGFVVAMYCQKLNHPDSTREQWKHSLTGNLCRCTGYDSILRACDDISKTSIQSPEELYPSQVIINELQQAILEPVLIESEEQQFFLPRLLEQAFQYRSAHPDCCLLSGGTDIGVQINKGIRNPEKLLCLSGIADLQKIEKSAKHWRIGSAVTLAELEVETETSQPQWHAMFKRHGSPLIRNSATLAGNLGNASPIADAIPLLLVIEATIELGSIAGVHPVKAGAFFTGYRRTAISENEIITAIVLPTQAIVAGQQSILKLYKVSRRQDMDISTFTSAIYAEIVENRIEQIRIAMGGVGPVVHRLEKTEAFLKHKSATAELMEAAGATAAEEISPISDVRGSKEYRLTLCQNTFARFFHDVMEDMAIDAR